MKNYVLCVQLDNECPAILNRLKGDIELRHSRIHLVSVVEIKVYSSEFATFTYPVESQYKEIEEAALRTLTNLQHVLGLVDSQVVKKCFFDFDPQTKIKHYLNEVDAQLVVTASRGKHGIEGLFSSSFSDFLIKHSPCDVLVMRPNK